MLTAYFDEFGHSRDEKRRYVGMAGFCAESGVWEVFEARWKSILHNAGVPGGVFHATDFAHSVEAFKGWRDRKDDREALVGVLVDCLREAQAMHLAAVVSVEDFNSLTERQRLNLGGDPYRLAFYKCTQGSTVRAMFEPPNEKVAMVYALQREFGMTPQGKMLDWWHEIRRVDPCGARMGAFAASEPSEIVPLQAADFLAYELGRDFERRAKEPKVRMRWPLRQILQMWGIPSPNIIVFDRVALLGWIRESDVIEDKTGCEEVDGIDWRERNRNSRMAWTLRYGEFKLPPDIEAKLRQALRGESSSLVPASEHKSRSPPSQPPEASPPAGRGGPR